jgi:hypothetical protein
MVIRQPLVKRAVLVILCCACGPTTEPGVTVLATSDVDAVAARALEFLPTGQLRHEVSQDPASDAARRGGFVIALVKRDDCTQCYRLEGDDHHITVKGGSPLGLEYGLAHALELFGYGFFHPWVPHVPDEPTPADTGALGKEYAPEVDVRRGLHLHTLHPIEAYYDYWETTPGDLDGARRTNDFIVKNRGNYVEWAALNSIVNDSARADAYRAHTKAVVDDAHARGMTAGVNIQLFGNSNLQQAFDLIEDGTDPSDPVPEMTRRLHVLLDGVGFDAVGLSFGEFFSLDPALFIQRVDQAYQAIQSVQPGTEVTVLIHVGGEADLQVTYMGETMTYYFLVKYCTSPLTPWVHSVMYYNLYEDTGGAYLLNDFSEHRAFLEGKLRAGQKAGYNPESAYWVAFDNSMPMYLPLYVRSRHLDLSNLRKAGVLHDHVEFSTGFEWGYWQNDAAVLRMTYALPDDWAAEVRGFFHLYGGTGDQLAGLIAQLAEAQHDALIGERLAGYLAGRDQIIDAGKKLGIVSQPDRVQFGELDAMSAADKLTFAANVLDPLDAFNARVTQLDMQRAALALPSDPFLTEMDDAFEVTARRGRFVSDLYRAVLDHDASKLDAADMELNGAQAVVSHRRKLLHDPDPLTLIHNTTNDTFYQYGYLLYGDQLCYWVRERIQARNVVLAANENVPGCIF